MADTLRDIPEFIEKELGESLQARTDALGNTSTLDILHTYSALLFVILNAPSSISSLQGAIREICLVAATVDVRRC